MVASGKRKRATGVTTTQPITAFFARKRPTPAAIEVADPEASAARDVVEDIEEEDDDDADVTVVATPPRAPPRVLHTAHLTRMLQRRELGASAAMLAHSVPGSSARRRKQQTDQRLARWALTQFRVLPIELVLPDDALRVVQSHRLVSHCDEFYASCLAFDSHGALLVAGASNGVIAVFDCDELFYRTLNVQQGVLTNAQAPLYPIHMVFTGMEVQRVQWNPMNEDEIACCFLNRNEIFLYNLQKFPSKPDVVLKATSRPSSGYTDLVFLPPPALATAAAGNKKKSKIRTGTVVAADIDGAVRAWDLRFPTKPQWTVSTGSQAVTSLALSHDKCLLLCATEGGVILTYDVKKLIVPAFGSRPMPQRKTVIRLVDVILPHLPFEAAAALKYAMQESNTTLAVTSLQFLLTSTIQVVVQLRNEWVVVLDTSTGTILKLHTPVKESAPALRLTGQQLPASVLHSVGNELDPHARIATMRQRHSWLHHHRCPSAIAFHGDMVCSGLVDENALNVIDLHRMDIVRANRDSSTTTESLPPSQDTADRLSRFCIDVPTRTTAVAVHPTQHWILCGGADLRIHLVGVAGGMHDPILDPVLNEQAQGGDDDV